MEKRNRHTSESFSLNKIPSDRLQCTRRCCHGILKEGASVGFTSDAQRCGKLASNVSGNSVLQLSPLLAISRSKLLHWLSIFTWVVLSMSLRVAAAPTSHLHGSPTQTRSHTRPHSRIKVDHSRGLQSISGLQSAALSPDLSQDQAVLLSMEEALASYNSAVNSILQTWVENNSSGPCSGWSGVTCRDWNGETRVTALNLTSLHLRGPIPSAVANLTALSSLNISDNLFNGSIPPEIGDCTNLQVLDLSQNHLSGTIPKELGNLTHLEALDLSSNFLTGAILPELLSNPDSLKMFNVSFNNLTGLVPKAIWSCKNLQILGFSNNGLNGDLPGGFGQLEAPLKKLDLVSNESTGILHSWCQNLQKLDVSWNQLKGSIPAEMGNCSKLVMLNLQGNSFSGVIPGELGQLGNLQWLGLGSNNLTGDLPYYLARCAGLYLLDVSNNSLSGPIPAWLSQMTSLMYLTMHSNHFTGGLPPELMTLQHLLHLDVSNNSLEGEIPPALGNVSNLMFLRLSCNQFNGTVPGELGNLGSLQALDLSSNQLIGTIPPTLGNLQDLLWLQLGSNYLTGPIPPQLSNCTSLLWLNLGENMLTGDIPLNLGFIGHNSDEIFRRNQALPWLPVGLGECMIVSTWIPANSQPFDKLFTNLEHQQCHMRWETILTGALTFPINHVSGDKIVLGYWQLSDNQLTGKIPDLTHSLSLGFLLTAKNCLSGPIPLEIGELPLYNLNVSYNLLNGSIPESLGNLSNLASLDMSYNSLSGDIPHSINQLTSLSEFNVSYNVQLTGSVPTENQFLTFTMSSYTGDPNLCFNPGPYTTQNRTSWQANVTVCGLISPSRAPAIKLASMGTSIIVLGIVLWALWAFISVGLCLVSKKRELEHVRKQMVMSDGQGWPSSSVDRECSFTIPVASFGTPCLKALTYADLLAATDNFSEEHIIGDGGFGVVYKAKLADGTSVAIKKLFQEGEQGLREFQAEMETLGNINHENLVPLLGYCCNNQEKLLVYKCISNGSLDDWLYGNADSLDWPARLHIALCVAQGLCFLHHDCVPHIIHRDMKASNILLDESFNACLTDFGLARHMDVTNTHVSTVVAGTPGYVPPEYGQTWRATVKGDVYSFGVVLLELVSGKRPTGPHFNGLEGANLVDWVRKLQSQGRQEEICEPIVNQTGHQQELLHFIHLGLLCTDELPAHRPTMVTVVRVLKEIKNMGTSLSP